MNAMLDRLQASDRAQRAFVSDASHELRSPLATLSTAAELAGRTSDEDVRTRLLETMNAELVRMRGLVGQPDDPRPGRRPRRLAAARSTSTSTTWSTTRSDGCAPRAGSTVRARIEPVRVRADLARVAQPLRNLVDNAERHAADARRADPATPGRRGGHLGRQRRPRVDPEDRERIFERFVRLDLSRSSDAGGSGLGPGDHPRGPRLAGGRRARGRPSQNWCRFEIRLPLTGPRAGERAAGSPSR